MTNKLVYGVGTSDKGKHLAWFNGRKTKAYNAWSNMLQRCYSQKELERYPTYIGCSVCNEWLSFQSFAEWYELNHPKDGGSYDLDKDLKVLGNKVYSPDTCLFVSQQVNKFTIDCGASRGMFLIGVVWNLRDEKFQAGCRNPFTKKLESLGRFTSELKAHLAWRKRKSELAYELAIIQDNPEVRDAILNWKLALDNNLIHPY